MNEDDILMKQYRENLNFLIGLKNYIGNIDNRIHDSVIVLVLDYLKVIHPDIENKNWIVKMGSQSGVDVEGILNGESKVIAELKTTKPYGSTDFGAQQKEMVLKDLKRLESAHITNKYFFVIDHQSFDILKRKYQKGFPSVRIINILDIKKDDIAKGERTTEEKFQAIENTEVHDEEWDIEITLTEGPINGNFFNIPKKYQFLVQEGDIEILNDSGKAMYCNTVASMGKGRITKNLSTWYKSKKFRPGDRFYLKKLGDKKFKVVKIKRVEG